MDLVILVLLVPKRHWSVEARADGQLLRVIQAREVVRNRKAAETRIPGT